MQHVALGGPARDHGAQQVLGGQFGQAQRHPMAAVHRVERRQLGLDRPDAVAQPLSARIDPPALTGRHRGDGCGNRRHAGRVGRRCACGPGVVAQQRAQVGMAVVDASQPAVVGATLQHVELVTHGRLAEFADQHIEF